MNTSDNLSEADIAKAEREFIKLAQTRMLPKPLKIMIFKRSDSRLINPSGDNGLVGSMIELNSQYDILQLHSQCNRGECAVAGGLEFALTQAIMEHVGMYSMGEGEEIPIHKG